MGANTLATINFVLSLFLYISSYYFRSSVSTPVFSRELSLFIACISGVIIILKVIAMRSSHQNTALKYLATGFTAAFSILLLVCLLNAAIYKARQVIQRCGTTIDRMNSYEGIFADDSVYEINDFSARISNENCRNSLIFSLFQLIMVTVMLIISIVCVEKELVIHSEPNKEDWDDEQNDFGDVDF